MSSFSVPRWPLTISPYSASVPGFQHSRPGAGVSHAQHFPQDQGAGRRGELRTGPGWDTGSQALGTTGSVLSKEQMPHPVSVWTLFPSWADHQLQPRTREIPQPPHGHPKDPSGSQSCISSWAPWKVWWPWAGQFHTVLGTALCLALIGERASHS